MSNAPRFRWTNAPPGSIVSPAKALPVLRTALAARPDELGLRLALARCLYDCGGLQEIVALLGPLDNGAATPPEAAFHLGRAVMLLSDNERAVALLGLAAEAGIPQAAGELARALTRLGRFEEAAAAAELQLARNPASPRAQKALTTALLGLGKPQLLYDRCVELWHQGIRTAQVIAGQAQSAAMLGHDDEFDMLISRSRLFDRRHLDLGADFPETLAQEVLANRFRIPSFSYKPTRGEVTRIDDFDAVEGDAARRFFSAVKGAVEDYFAERASFGGHPLIMGCPRDVRIESWSLSMGPDGYEEWHVHSHAWLSGVYYARVPAISRAPGSKAGRIEFGKGPWAAAAASLDNWIVTPEPGLLLLFPGYYPHRTWPTETEGHRIGIAFNVLTASGSSAVVS